MMTKTLSPSHLLVNCTYLAITLSLSVLACQTSGKNELSEEAKASQILDTQKQLARNHLDSGSPEAALSVLRPLVRQNPDDASLQTLMGLTQLGLHNPPRAIQNFRKAYKIDKQPGSALNLSSAYIESGSPEKALKLLAAILKNKKMSTSYAYRERIFHNIAYSYVKLGENKKAESWLNQALEENPTFFPSHLELARLYEKTKRPAMALKAYRKAIDYCHVCFEPVESFANIHLKIGNPLEARNALIKFTRVEGIASSDRAKAEQLLKAAKTAAIQTPRAG
jgi:Tfp pilus assembly protein PilF